MTYEMNPIEGNIDLICVSMNELLWAFFPESVFGFLDFRFQ